ncbi:Smr/MutS family protein [Bartonella rattaustraliani]|uniref:Smr/MutS family protein n=1 Tax=Bartonella rattaustraliani TaxID=481139 RepID=UPI0002FB1F3E|nr:Smr/MutS family protein [Bartonella rattaustraliani]
MNGDKKKDLLSSQDRLLWEKVCRTTIPLYDKFHSSITTDNANTDNKKQHITQGFLLSQGVKKISTVAKKEKGKQGDKLHFFDRAVHRKIAKGRYPIEARLDLHGCMQEEAYFFLKNFLQLSQQNGLRYVLVITGKGRSPGSDGALYKFVSHWLSTPAFRYYIHAFTQAARQHGGEGALYVLLRRFVSNKGT